MTKFKNMLFEFGRKFIVFVIATAILILVTNFMQIDFYNTFSNYFTIIVIGFFCGNGIEHIAGALKK